MEMLRHVFHEEDWPEEAETMYERIEVLGQGSFGLVWMGKRMTPPEDEYDDEFVALKNIEIKEERGKVYAQREISILTELRHPNVIRLIRAFPVYKDTSRLVALQLARGPNLLRVVTKRGAVGLPLARLVCRQLIAAVSYLHGRAVLHRDIKPTNLILENTQIPPNEYYDYSMDSSIWSDDDDAVKAVESNKWRVMLVDFGFARALEEKEIRDQSKPMRTSILLEAKDLAGIKDPDESDDESDTFLVERAAAMIGGLGQEEPEFVGIGDEEKTRRRVSHISNLEDIDESCRPEEDNPSPAPVAGAESNANGEDGDADPNKPATSRRASTTLRGKRRARKSTTRTKLRSMSALGTKAYAAPEIKHKLRNKTQADTDKKNAALTECVADYGMIVDAYSVGWTLRVILTGVPPNSTISQYMRKHQGKQPEEPEEVGCCCFGGGADPVKDTGPPFRVRDTDEMPKPATLFISALTKPNPEERMTVREAQNHPWVKGADNEQQYEVTQGDHPSRHGDPVVTLKCARELSRIVEVHHQ